MSTRLLFCLALLVTSCREHGNSNGSKPTSPPTPPSSTSPRTELVTLEHTFCNGHCPVYKLTVYADGRVEYDGELYVKHNGRRITNLPPEKLSALAAAFEKAGYFQLADSYELYAMTCMPTVITSYHDGKRLKKISHYHGDDTAPEALTLLENEIDRIVGSEAFIGTEAEREKLFGF